jgi:hypothetical protein
MTTSTIVRTTATTRKAGFLSQYFYLFMSLLIAVTVIYGFSHTIDHNLIHASPVRPWLLYLHGAIFSSWVVFFILQSALIRTHNVRIHRTLGWFGVALGITILILGVSTAITMAHFNTFQLHQTGAAQFIAVPLWDILCFTIAFALAIHWRRKPEFHRRLILIASCVLTAAAFGRFPESILPFKYFYVGVDLLIFLGVLRDLSVNKRVHPVYLYALPALIFGQTIVTNAALTPSPHWQKIADAILR